MEAFGQDRKSLGIIFETATPIDTPREITALLDWTNGSLAAKELHPLLIIAVFDVHFLAIHPFLDGNGRLSRILTTLLLLQQGYAYVQGNPVNWIDPWGLNRYDLCDNKKGILKWLCEKSVDYACYGPKNVVCCRSEYGECLRECGDDPSPGDVCPYDGDDPDENCKQCAADYMVCLSGAGPMP